MNASEMPGLSNPWRRLFGVRATTGPGVLDATTGEFFAGLKIEGGQVLPMTARDLSMYRVHEGVLTAVPWGVGAIGAMWGGYGIWSHVQDQRQAELSKPHPAGK